MTYYRNQVQGSSFIEKLEKKEWDLITDNNVKIEFPRDLAKIGGVDLKPYVIVGRMDLRSIQTFPIDAEDTKDRDDALSISFDGVFHLGVHIADVAAYVRPCSRLDREAMERGTSIYFPTMTIPMLPKYLSNDLCSLCCKDRLTVSVLMDIDAEGNLMGYRIVKSVIHPVLTGVYSEVNQVLAGNASPETAGKYHPVFNSLTALRELAWILRSRRAARGADTVSDKAPAKVLFTDNTVELVPDSCGIAEMIVEEAMIQANYCVADYFRKKELPAIFRTQNRVNTLAEYLSDRSCHASLALDCYSHFTSPIRRLPDLRMAQLLSAHLLGCNNESLHYLFDDLLNESSELATKRFRRAKDMQRACIRLCYQEYFKNHVTELYSGVVKGIGERCMYIRLDNLNIDIPVAGVYKSIGTKVKLRVDVCQPGWGLQGYDVEAA